jgi:hypothetical protein
LVFEEIPNSQGAWNDPSCRDQICIGTPDKDGMYVALHKDRDARRSQNERAKQIEELA